MHIRDKLLWVLTALFTARVAAQALQTWWPLAGLPPAPAFQGSRLPYPVLLAAQLLIIACMLRLSRRMQRGRFVPDARRARTLAWAGGLYMVLALGRLAVGLAWAGAPHWFHAWIPGVFHLVLAGFVLTWAACHRAGAAA